MEHAELVPDAARSDRRDQGRAVTLEQLLEKLERQREYGPYNLPELIYQLALQLKSARAEIALLRQRTGSNP